MGAQRAAHQDAITNRLHRMRMNVEAAAVHFDELKPLGWVMATNAGIPLPDGQGKFMVQNPDKPHVGPVTLQNAARIEAGNNPTAPAAPASPRSGPANTTPRGPRFYGNALKCDRRLAAAPNSSSQLCSAGILSVGLIAGFILGKITKCRSQRRISREF